MTSIIEKELILKDYLKSLGSVAVAYSSGVDSTYLLKIAHLTLGDNAIAITARAQSFPSREFEEASQFCKSENIKHIAVDINQLDIPDFADNPPDRCYICKRELFSRMKIITSKEGINELVEGSNTDDPGDYRPGLKAIEELGIKSPLRHAGLTKNDIRELSKRLNLPTWNKPSFACLASRFVYGETITAEKLRMVEKAERFLLDMNIGQVRVRIHGNDMARIEVNSDTIDMLNSAQKREQIVTALHQFGFHYVTLDLEGYRTGSMNHFI